MTYLHICDRLGGYYTFHSHNLYLDTLLNYGVIGSLVIFFCAISQMRIIISRLKRNICTSMNLLILAALTAVLVHGLTDVTIFSPQTGMLFLLLCTSMGIQAREKAAGGTGAASRAGTFAPDPLAACPVWPGQRRVFY